MQVRGAAPPGVADAGRTFLGLRVGPVRDVARAGSFAAAARGVALRVGPERVFGVPLLPAAPLLAQTAPSGLEPYRGSPPAVGHASQAYFVSHGNLQRAPVVWSSDAIGANPPAAEVLARDAVDGTRVVTTTAYEASSAARDIVAYIARPADPTGDLRARVWVEGASSFDLCPEGSGANTVDLRAADRRVLAVSVDERAAMSPIHARTFEVRPDGGVELDQDVVVRVGPPSESHTEVVLAVGPEGPVALVALPEDAVTFGLFSLAIGWEPRLDAPTAFRPYANGIDPAPVAAFELCSRAWVAYARPLGRRPEEGTALVLSRLDGYRLGEEAVLVEAQRIPAVSTATQAGRTALVTWIADGRVEARALSCP